MISSVVMVSLCLRYDLGLINLQTEQTQQNHWTFSKRRCIRQLWKENSPIPLKFPLNLKSIWSRWLCLPAKAKEYSRRVKAFPWVSLLGICTLALCTDPRESCRMEIEDNWTLNLECFCSFAGVRAKKRMYLLQVLQSFLDHSLIRSSDFMCAFW